MKIGSWSRNGRNVKRAIALYRQHKAGKTSQQNVQGMNVFDSCGYSGKDFVGWFRSVISRER